MAIARANPQLSAGGVRYPATHTLSYAVPSGNDRVLVVRGHFLDHAAGNPGPDFAVTVTYNGVAMTQAATATGSSVNRRIRVHLWYLINPPVGTANIVVTFPDQADDSMASSTLFAVTLTGVKQVAPTGATANSSGNPTNSLALTGCAAESLILAAVVSDGTGPPSWVWTTATEEYDGSYGDSTILGGHTGAYYTVPSAGNVTLTATRNATATGPGQVGIAVEFLIAVDEPVDVELNTLTLTAAAIGLSVIPGAVARVLDLLVADIAVQPLGVMPGAIATLLDLLGINGLAHSVDVVPGGVTIDLSRIAALLDALQLWPSVAGADIAIELARLPAAIAAKPLLVVPGMAAVDLATLAASLSALPLTVSYQAADLIIQLLRLSIAAASSPLTVAPGEVTVPLALQQATLTQINLLVFMLLGCAMATDRERYTAVAEDWLRFYAMADDRTGCA